MSIQRHLFIIMLFAPLASWGQYSTGNSLVITVYANIHQEDRETEFFNLTNGQIPEERESMQSFRLGHFSPALSIFHADKHLSEIELAFLRYDKEDGVLVTELSGPFPGTTRTFALGIRYAFNFNVLASQKNVVQPHFGLAVLPYVHTVKTSPEIKALYTTTRSDLGLLGQFIARLIIRFSDFVYLDVNAPVSLIEVRQQIVRFQDGGHKLPDIKESKTNLSWLPGKAHLRLGVGVMF